MTEQDKEIQVLEMIVGWLDPLEDDARKRVIQYLQERYANGGSEGE